jgi:predicted lactoylglutathione lyase
MLLTRKKFQTFTPRQICDAVNSQSTLC